MNLIDRILFITKEIEEVDDKRNKTFSDKVEINSLKHHLADLYEQLYIENNLLLKENKMNIEKTELFIKSYINKELIQDIKNQCDKRISTAIQNTKKIKSDIRVQEVALSAEYREIQYAIRNKLQRIWELNQKNIEEISEESISERV